MDSNQNQRKRTGRLAKPDSIEGMGPPPQVSDNNEVLDVSTIAISPALEEVESRNNVPAAECRRSSRKKIIKFDVRDLLNKNRKPHKIQIEARIDSNAPSTSKTSTATVGEITCVKPSSTSGDLLTKQKTFLEKSAIFRRFSISQEPKPPPPPLPMPPSLLVKAGDSKDAPGQGGTTSRRLSRTQEFFSNVMIKPKQTTSLIVAQMESSAPSLSGKRKNANKVGETETESIETTTVQKRRGRPLKSKKSTEDTSQPTSPKEDPTTKKLTPEKATNWKEYKACLAQQTGTDSTEDLNSQTKIETSSQNTLESLGADVVIEIVSNSSNNSNIEESLDNKSLIDEDHHGTNKDDPSIELNIIPDICLDDSNSKHSVINETSTQVDLKDTDKNENPIKSHETEKFVQSKPRNSEDSIVVDDDKQSQKELNIDKEVSSSQSTIKESIRNIKQTQLNVSLVETTESKEKTTLTNLDDSSEELKTSQLSKEKLTSNKDKNVPEISIHKKSSDNNKEENIDNTSISEERVMESKGNINPTTVADSSHAEKHLTQCSDEHVTECLKENISDDSLQKEKVEQNTDNTNDSNQDDNLQRQIDTKKLQSSKEVTSTRKNRSKYNNSPQEQDLLVKEKKSKNPHTTKERKSRSRHNNSPQEKTNSPTIESKDDKTKLSNETNSKFSEDATIAIKCQSDLDVSLQKDKDTISDQSCSENKSMQHVSLITDSTSDDGQTAKIASKNTRSISKLKVSSPEKTSDNIVQSTKESETKNELSTQTKEAATEACDFVKVKENKVLLQTSEQTKTNEAESAETSIEKVAETTASQKRTPNKKAINDQKKNDTEAAMEDAVNENTKLSEKLVKEKRLEEAIDNVPDEKDKIIIKKTPRNKKNLNKLEESLKHAEYKNDSSTSKNSNKLQNTPEPTNMREVINSDTDIILSSEECQNLKRTELKTPDPSIRNTTQDEQENSPNIKMPTNEPQEAMLSQPSTPSENNPLTFSRTSSSSESENQSERSSFSSETTSSTSTSTRSYKSGDKLKISLKRISLPQSPPSSSSQISTSEEPCSPSLSLSEDIKKKSPKAKRSKRLQKKFVELLDNQNSTENIDDCFQKITTHNNEDMENPITHVDIKETELQNTNDVTEEIQENSANESTVTLNEMVEESLIVSAETTNLIDVSKEKEFNEHMPDNNPASIEFQQEQMKSVITDESDKIATQQPQTAKDLIEPIKPTTSKVKQINDYSTITKRKSLRNRKDTDSTEKNQETKISQEEDERTIKEKEMQKSKPLGNRQDENEQETKETCSKVAETKETKEILSIVADTVEERDIEQQQEPHMDKPTAQESDKLQSEEQQDKLIESKQKQRKPVKDRRQPLIKPKQQQKRKPKDEQTDNQDNNKGDSGKRLEVYTEENQPDKIEIKEHGELLAKPSRLKVENVHEPPTEVKENEAAIEITETSKTVDKEQNQLIVSTDLPEDKDKFKTTDNIQTEEITGTESATEIAKEIDDSCEFKKESSATKTDELSPEVNEKKDSKKTPTKSKSIKDESCNTKDSDKNVSAKSVRSCIDSKENETSKITSTRSKTTKDKNNSVVDSSKTSSKSTKDFATADIQTLQKDVTKISANKEIPKEEETDSTKTSPTDNKEASSSIKDNETSLLPHKEAKDELAMDVTNEELCESLNKKCDMPSENVEDTTKNCPKITNLQSPLPFISTKIKPDIERPTSVKRKSLRNQKESTSTTSSLETNEQEKTNEEVSLENSSIDSTEQSQVVIEEPVFIVNTQEVKDNKLEEPMEEPIKVPKKRSRKSRFKNLHSPEAESGTESSTDKQTPIEETIVAEKKDEDQALSPKENVEVAVTIEHKTDKDDELFKKNEQELPANIKEHPEDVETLTTVLLKEHEDVVKMTVKEKSPIKPDCVQESASVPDNSMKTLKAQTAPTESYIIQNVSIETNTLLDILRTVQSNTAAAALEANNKKTENPTEEISTKDENNTLKNMQHEDLPSTSQDRNLLSLKSLRKLETESNANSPTRIDTGSPLTLKSSRKLETNSNTNSPNRCDADSPLTLKKVTISPTRSDSNSPLTLKKVGLSPSRSDTSSPLTLKKVTRRYERRSRRGEESSQKTLEETFAEIAAQSSKAVLAAKSFDSNEEFPVGFLNDDELSVGHEGEETTSEAKISTENQEILEDTNVVNKSVAEVVETIEDIEKDSAKIDDIQEKSKVSENSKNTSETDKLEDLEKMSVVMAVETSESNITETVSGTPVAEKVTPARRGRKPKNRSLETVLPTTKDSEIKNSPKSKKDVEKSTAGLVKENDPEETTSEPETPLKPIEEHLQKEESVLETPTKLEGDDVKLSNVVQDSLKDTRELSQTPEPSLKAQDDSKLSKKSSKKSDPSKELPSTSAETDNVANEDDVRTPKQAVKKRDASLTKSETKSLTKKSTKKTKNNEEELLSGTQKEDSLPKTTTPPPKRGRKPKNQQESLSLQTTTSSKKKNKKESSSENYEAEALEEKRKDLESMNESESMNTSLDKSLDEKMAKKKRQKKLKEAFEAALTEDINKNADITSNSSSSTSSTSSTNTFGLTLLNKSPPPEAGDSLVSENTREACLTPVEEDPDPLKDIEKFIADGVNLLKKDYKLDEDSVGDVITTTIKTEEIPIKSPTEEDKPIYNTFETPADTPVTTPSVTPPPKSPISLESTTPDENAGVRRSHRIKLITQTPKALVGRGLVKDKERFSIKDDVETKSHYTLDDHLLDLAEVEAKNAKFLKEMEERLSNFQVIKENEYLCERVISREARKMICDCFLTHEEEERGELGCGEDCLNRLLMIECGPECNVKERCTNKRFQKLLCSPCRVFRTEKKGFGIMADIEILPGEFIMEYVGEVIDTDIFEQRRIMYSQDKNRHYYFMALRSDAIIDATIQGNISRFINHSCDPNAETQKWTVNGELRIGFFSRKSIMPGEEITFNYQYQRYGREAQRCYCESSNCRGWIGQEPTSDEGEQIDDDDDEYEESEDDEEEEEEQDTSNLLVHDDDEDSDASVTDPEEVQKKLEMAAAQAEVELAPINISEDKDLIKDSLQTENKENDDSVKPETEEEDSKSKFKKLLSKMAEKVAAKQKQNKRQQKLQRKKKSKESSADLTNKLRFSEDPDIEDEVEFLRECGLKNQSDTLRLSRLMVRAKLVQTRLNLLDILQKGDLPCRRLFLDYHGLRLVHGWMSEDAGNMQIRLALLQTLDTLPIANKTVLTDSKVMQMVRNWCGTHTSVSPNEDSSSSNSNSQDNSLQPNTNLEEGSDLQELQKLALKLITTWDGLPEIFRIPKKERIEQMKEHEREADRQYAANAETEENKTSTDRYSRNRFGKTSNFTTTNASNRFTKPNNGNPLRALNTRHEETRNISKAQRREMFAAKVARDEAGKRMAEERREFETKCRFFGLDPKKTRPQDVPFCVNPATGQWYSVERKPIITPPSYAHVQVPIKPKSTDPNDYQLPAACSSLNAQWKYAITPQGKIYYYHIKYRIPQWEPPTAAQLQLSEIEADDDDSESELTATAGEDSSEDDDEILIGMDAVQLRAYIDRKVETRRQKRYQRLVDQRPISPRREEDRVYNQIEVRKYKENKEKIRKRKEEMRRKRAEILRQSSLNMCTLGSVLDAGGIKLQTESDEELGALPIQDYLLSSDEDGDLKTDVNSALLDKIVEGDNIVDELDALTSKRQLKRPLPPHRDLSEASTSTLAVLSALEKQEYKKRKLEKKEKKKPKDQDAKYRKNKEKFRCEIAGIIVHYLKPYRRETCPRGHIQTNEDFNHLARKLTHFVMIKELKYCESVGQTLVVTESVKNKSREFIKKYMAKYGDVYVKPANDPDFKDIPFTL